MREEDKQECWHLGRVEPLDALQRGYEASSYCRTILLDGKVVAIFGVCPGEGELGIPWMLASDLLKKIRKSFLRECFEFVEEMSKGYTILHNVVWCKNKEHIRWLRWLGFTFRDEIPLGPDGELFYPFYKVS